MTIQYLAYQLNSFFHRIFDALTSIWNSQNLKKLLWSLWSANRIYLHLTVAGVAYDM